MVSATTRLAVPTRQLLYQRAAISLSFNVIRGTLKFLLFVAPLSHNPSNICRQSFSWCWVFFCYSLVVHTHKLSCPVLHDKPYRSSPENADYFFVCHFSRKKFSICLHIVVGNIFCSSIDFVKMSHSRNSKHIIIMPPGRPPATTVEHIVSAACVIRIIKATR